MKGDEVVPSLHGRSHSYLISHIESEHVLKLLKRSLNQYFALRHMHTLHIPQVPERVSVIEQDWNCFFLVTFVGTRDYDDHIMMSVPYVPSPNPNGETGKGFVR